MLESDSQSESRAPETATVDEPGKATSAVVVLDDLPCRWCGYNLRGLSPRGECPECRTAVSHSLQGDLLRYSNPSWVRAIAHGLLLLNIAEALWIAWMLVAAVQRDPAAQSMVMTGFVIIGLIAMPGVWLGTQREPAAHEREPPLSSRRLLRTFAVGAVVVEACVHWPNAPWPSAWNWLRLAGLAMWIGALMCAFRYAIALAQRVPDNDLAYETRGVMWGVIASYGMLGMIVAVAVFPRVPEALTIVFGLSCTALVACLVFTIWSLALVGRYARTLRRAAADAQMISDNAMAQRGHGPERDC